MTGTGYGEHTALRIGTIVIPPPATGLYWVQGNWEWWYVDEADGLYVRVARWASSQSVDIPSYIEIATRLAEADKSNTWCNSADVLSARVCVSSEVWASHEPQLRESIMRQLATEIGLRLLEREGQDHRVRIGELVVSRLPDYLIDARIVAWVSPVPIE